jgi:hypothetical protein
MELYIENEQVFCYNYINFTAGNFVEFMIGGLYLNQKETTKIFNDLSNTKNSMGGKNEGDIRFIIQAMSTYSKSDLQFIRDCIDLSLIYRTYHL